MEWKFPVLYKEKKDCCACGACLNICPKKAISMEEDECGYIYPSIDERACIKCGLCKSVCAYQNTYENNNPQKVYAAISRNSNQAFDSSSGGIFAALATKVLETNGSVYGVILDDNFDVYHTAIDNVSELYKLQGSKYVQSDTRRTFKDAKKKLEIGMTVLYSGTPCQIAGFNGYLGKSYANLITIDIVCHGVPNNRMFKEYIEHVEDKSFNRLYDFKFRDKNLGWGKNGSAKCYSSNMFHGYEITKEKLNIWESSSSYLTYFGMGSLFRESCYECKYACEHRPADITLGDFWGIEKQHPEYITDAIWKEQIGYSLVIANTEKGKRFLEESEEYLDMKTSTFDKVSKYNLQLKQPSKKYRREEILNLYKFEGWKAIEDEFAKQGLKRYSSQIKSIIPVNLKRELKKWLK